MDNLRGSLLMVVAMAGFAAEDLFVKLLSRDLPVGQMLMMLGAGGCAVFAIAARAQGARLISPVLLTRSVMLRNLGEIIAAVTYVTALAMADLSTVSAILQATPLAVTLGAALFMGAQVGWRRWSAILVGFGGVLMIVRPGFDAFDISSLFAVVSVIGLAIRDLATRAIPASVSSMQLSCYAFGTMVPTGALLLAFSGGAAMPDATAWAYLLGALIFGVLGYYFIVGAMRIGEIAAVTPFRYARLLFALILGMSLLGERPDLWTLLGAAIIIASGLYTLIREQRIARRAYRQAKPKGPL
ncbi:DMT family transporter [Roseovarius nanhaiticus]|uniref:Permease of the drug/metabolite transporter (DMT) superfamily n=1 Tax=Roseovarius nanhaiticus TaxID=573024 RepID=A0A1N7GCX5_9RHOB|nr:DMT family transporter [Roseovarius nanhaiticus]SEK30433.1 Permease of the drug/metabolite transporter (DMT) superfamily [Roseovarius nanhaiticus]SIS10400.1 Permease of the drug/metabolite transporter (DMT) superfamily [Roseovarius nanhaiticus]